MNLVLLIKSNPKGGFDFRLQTRTGTVLFQDNGPSMGAVFAMARQLSVNVIELNATRIKEATS